MNLRRLGWLAVGLLGAAGCGLWKEAAPGEAQSPVSSLRATPWVSVERVVGPAQDEDRLPWVLAFHGLGDRADRFVRVFDGWDGPPARVVVLQAPDSRGDGFSWFPVRVGDGRPEVLEPAVRTQAAEVARFIDALAGERRVIGRPVVTGFSQGGILSLALARFHSDQVAAAVPVSGWWSERWLDGHGAPVTMAPTHVLHGEADDVLPWIPLRRSLDRLRAADAPVTYAGFPGVGHRVSSDMRRVWHRRIQEFLSEEVARQVVDPL